MAYLRVIPDNGPCINVFHTSVIYFATLSKY